MFFLSHLLMFHFAVFIIIYLQQTGLCCSIGGGEHNYCSAACNLQFGSRLLCVDFSIDMRIALLRKQQQAVECIIT